MRCLGKPAGSGSLVASRVVEVKVLLQGFDALIGPVFDGVPFVDGGAELNSGVGAFPSCFSYLTEQGAL